MQSILLLFVASALFYTAAFIPRFFLKTANVAHPAAAERLFGFAFLSLTSLLSLRYFGSALAGAVVGAVVAWFAFAKTCFEAPPPRPRFELSWGNVFKLLFCAGVALVYVWFLLGQSWKYLYPNIFDLPKHLASIVSVAAATAWPAPNPYFPTGGFAYNLLFYAPLGAMARLLPGSEAPGFVFALAVMFVTWNGISLLESIVAAFGGCRRHTMVAVLFATISGGFAGLVRPTDVPSGFMVARWKLSAARFDDPFAMFLYVPQHLFAIGCFLSSFVLLAHSTLHPLRQLLLITILMSAAVLSSAILAPIFMLASLPVAALLGVRLRRLLHANEISLSACLRWFGATLFLGFFLVAPFLLDFRGWAEAGEAPKLQLLSGHIWYVIVSAGPVLAFGIAGLLLLPAGDRQAAAFRIAFLSMVAIFVVCWLSVSYPESSLKTSHALRLILVVPASFAFSALWSRLETVWIGRATLVVCAFALPGALTLCEVGYFVSTSFIPRPHEQQELIRQVAQMPGIRTVGLVEPNQQLAAALGTLTVMDFRVYRRDAYLLADARPKLDLVIRQMLNPNYENIPQIMKYMDALVLRGTTSQGDFISAYCGPQSLKLRNSAYSLFDLRQCHVGGDISWTPVFHLGNASWQRWVGSALVAQPPDHYYADPDKLAVMSQGRGDIALLTALQLPPGGYRIIARVSGVVDGPPSGAAHISLHGVRKLISIPAGDYSSGWQFESSFTIDAPYSPGQLAFGLGGWSAGSGRLRLEDLTIERLTRR